MLLFIGILLLSGCSMLPQEAEEPPIDVAAPVVTQREVTAAKRGSIESRLTLNVAFGAERQTALYFRNGGRLRKLHATPGQQVAEGALLAELEAGTLPYDISMAEIDLEKSRLSLDTLVARVGFVNAPTAADLRKAELDVQQVEMKLNRLREQLADTRIHAPFAGQVVTVSAAAGDQVDAYKELLTFAATGSTVARATVDDGSAVQLQAGQKVEIFPQDGDPTPIKGKVLSVPAVGSAARDKVAVVAPDAPSERLKVGRNGKVEVITQARQNALLVPASAVRTFGGRKFVTVVNDSGRQEVAIKVGLENDQYVEVLEGIKEGDRVVSR